MGLDPQEPTARTLRRIHAGQHQAGIRERPDHWRADSTTPVLRTQRAAGQATDGKPGVTRLRQPGSASPIVGCPQAVGGRE
jgi:hypothetical protein